MKYDVGRERTWDAFLTPISHPHCTTHRRDASLDVSYILRAYILYVPTHKKKQSLQYAGTRNVLRKAIPPSTETSHPAPSWCYTHKNPLLLRIVKKSHYHQIPMNGFSPSVNPCTPHRSAWDLWVMPAHRRQRSRARPEAVVFFVLRCNKLKKKSLLFLSFVPVSSSNITVHRSGVSWTVPGFLFSLPF